MRYGPVVGGRVGYIAYTYMYTYIHTSALPYHSTRTTPHHNTPHHTLLFAGTVTAAVVVVVVEGSRARPRHWRVIIPFNSSRLIARIVCACSTEGERGSGGKRARKGRVGRSGGGFGTAAPVCLSRDPGGSRRKGWLLPTRGRPVSSFERRKLMVAGSRVALWLSLIHI